MVSRRLRPSSAGRWVPCPGSVALEALFPEEEESQAAREGTAAHWLASEALTVWATTDGGVPHIRGFLGQPTPNGVIVTEEMVDAVEVYVSDVMKIANQVGGLQSLYVEHQVDISTVHPNNAGTLDGGAHIVAQSTSRLYVWDFKFGWGIVSAFENWQLLDYAVGLLQEMLAKGQECVDIEFRIVQPRPYHREGSCRSWVLPVAELHPYIERLRMSAQQSQSENAPCVTGPHCGNCKARHDCETLQRAAYRHREILEGTVPLGLSGAALGNELALAEEIYKLAKDRYEGLQGATLAEIQKGQHVPGWTTEQKLGNREWNGSNEEVLALGELMGVDLSKPAVKSPNQAEKAGGDKAVIKAFTTRNPGAIKLVAQDPKHVEKVFTK